MAEGVKLKYNSCERKKGDTVFYKNRMIPN